MDYIIAAFVVVIITQALLEYRHRELRDRFDEYVKITDMRFSSSMEQSASISTEILRLRKESRPPKEEET